MARTGTESDGDGSCDTELLFGEPRMDEQEPSGFPAPWMLAIDYDVVEPAVERVARSSPGTMLPLLLRGQSSHMLELLSKLQRNFGRIKIVNRSCVRGALADDIHRRLGESPSSQRQTEVMVRQQMNAIREKG